MGALVSTIEHERSRDRRDEGARTLEVDPSTSSRRLLEQGTREEAGSDEDR
jgi:hypothetical protein